MGYAIELESVDHHFYIPVRIRFGVRRLNARFLLDTGASKCSIPLIVNDRILRLRIRGTDVGIQVAGGTANYDVVVLERKEEKLC